MWDPAGLEVYSNSKYSKSSNIHVFLYVIQCLHSASTSHGLITTDVWQNCSVFVQLLLHFCSHSTSVYSTLEALALPASIGYKNLHFTLHYIKCHYKRFDWWISDIQGFINETSVIIFRWHLTMNAKLTSCGTLIWYHNCYTSSHRNVHILFNTVFLISTSTSITSVTITLSHVKTISV